MSKVNTVYFSHDANALTDIKITAMRCDYGLEGYGLYWAIIEMFRTSEGYKLPLEKNTYRAIKVQTGATIDIEKFINDCINEYKETEKGNGLFNTDGKYFWAESLLKRMLKMEEISAKRKKAGQRGAKERWGKEESKPKQSKKRKISKPIANAIKNNSKCYKNNGKSIAKNGKIKSKSKIKYKIKLKDIKSIYPSNHVQTENKTLDEMMDEIDKNEFSRILDNCELHILDPALQIELKEILKEMYMNPSSKNKVTGLTSRHLLYALKQFAIANTKTNIQIPKQYFKKCILSALEQTELSSQFDLNTMYKMGD